MFESDPERGKNVYDRLFICLLFTFLAIGFLWLDKPNNALIFDEKYYVNAARNILKLRQNPDIYPNAAPGKDPNIEHPFLGKGIIAFSIMILGDNAWGWRTASVVFGTLALLAFYVLAKKLSGRGDLALFAALLLALSNLFYVHSRIATLDIFLLSLMLVGFYWYEVDRPFLSAFFLALATLSKLNGLLGFTTILVFHCTKLFIKSRETKKFDWRPLLGWLEKYVIPYFTSVIILFTIFDRIWVGYNNPLNHLYYIYDYYTALARATPSGIESYPWQWLVSEIKIPYLTLNIDVRYGEFVSTRPVIAFEGAINPLVIYLAIPAVAYAAYAAYKRGEETSLFSVIWFVTTYLPWYPMSIIGHRIMYLFYFLPTLPCVCLAIAYLFFDRNTDRIVSLTYLFAVFLGFAMLFPFKQVP